MSPDFANDLQLVAPRCRRRPRSFSVRVWIALSALSALFALSGCRPSTPATDSGGAGTVESDPASRGAGRPVVLTTILPVYCFASNVAGEFATVENLLPSGVGPHDYQLTPSDVARIRRSDLVIANGLDLERALFLMIDRMDSAGSIRVLEIASGLTENDLVRGEPVVHGGESGHGHGSHTHEGGADPHIWLDPLLAIRAVGVILEAFQALDPAHADGYEANAKRYAARLMALHDRIVSGLSDVDHRSFITFHDAFAYFARRYDLEIAGVVEPVPDVSPPPRHLVDLRNLIREQGIPVIFTEPQFRPKLALRLAEGLAVSVGELDTLETGPIVPSGYEDGMLRNLAELRKYLGSNSESATGESAR